MLVGREMGGSVGTLEGFVLGGKGEGVRGGEQEKLVLRFV